MAVNPNITADQLILLAQDPKMLEKFKSAKEFKFIVIGQTGTGKSTLINGLIGAEVAKVEKRLTTTGVTQKVESFSRKINGVEVVAYDSPGLEDGSGKEGDYLKKIYQTCQQGIDLVIFAISMTGMRFVPDNPDARAIVKLTRKLTPAIWKKTLVVLTQANRCEPAEPPQQSSKEERKTFFKTLVSDYKAAIHQTLKKTGIPAAIVEKVKVVPVGIEYERELLDGTLWFSNFWFECINAITSTEGCAAITKVNRHRFKKGKDVTDKDFQQPIHNQPIIVTTTQLITDTVRTVAKFATAGALVGALGFIGGPVGIVTVPIGLAVGITLGITMAIQ